jgi:anti-sigma regulatory factor (Ser/Thr protein kinase)
MIYRHKKIIREFDLETMNGEIEAFCERNQVPVAKLFSIQLIIEELVTNIIKYGKSEGSDETVEVELKIEAEEITLTISDNSTAFNPLQAGTPDLTLSAEERGMGGLGLYLVRQKVKSLNYENRDGFNILTAEI